MRRLCLAIVGLIFMMTPQLLIHGGARAASLKSHAHCHGQIRDTSGNVIASLDGSQGYVADYYDYFPQNQSHQLQCDSDAGNAGSSWLSDKGQMCHAFFEVNGGELVFWSYVGTHPWRDSGGATQGSLYGYPASCFAPTGHVFPGYYIFTLVYAPPGCTADSDYDCGTGNSVEYSSGSSIGTTTSLEHSTTSNTEFAAHVEIINFGASFEQTVTDGSEITVAKKSTHSVKYPDSGSAGHSGINHDLDLFYLLINPSVAISGWHDPVTGQNHAQWALGTKGGASAKIQRVQVSYLRCALAGVGPRPGGTGNGGGNYDPTGSCTAPGTHLLMPGQLDASGPNGFLPGLTYEDYRQILNQDLFWTDTLTQHAPIPSPRFQKEPVDFPYDPPTGFDGSSCPLETQGVENSKTETTSSSTENSFTASLGFGSEENALGLTQTITYTNKASTSRDTENSQGASVSIGCAGNDWSTIGNGRNYVGTYYDALYGTFMFTLENSLGQRILRGSVKDGDGDAVPHEPVRLVAGGQTYRTFTNRNGVYLFKADPSNNATAGTLFVGAGSTSGQSVALSPTAAATSIIANQTPTLVIRPSGPPPAPPSLDQAKLAQLKRVDGMTPTTAAPTDVSATLNPAIDKQTVRKPVATVGPATIATATATLATRAGPYTPPPLYIGVENHSPFARAKNVMITSIVAKGASGATLPYTGPTLPFLAPDGAALLAGRKSVIQLTYPMMSVAKLIVTAKADNVPAFTTVVFDSTPVSSQDTAITHH